VWSFVFRSFAFPFSHCCIYSLYTTFPHFDKRILVHRLSCFCRSTLISSLFMVFVSSLHRSRNCLRLAALLAVSFGASRNEFCSLLSLISPSRSFLLFSVYCSAMRVSSFSRAFIRCFHALFPLHAMRFCFITGIPFRSFFSSKYFASRHFLASVGCSPMKTTSFY
jgi:hypothetical protein